MNFKMFAVAALLLLVGCFKEHDTISIKADGNTSFRSEVVITDKTVDFQSVDQFSTGIVKSLEKAGWKVSREWVSKSAPIRMVVKGEGNLKTVQPVQEFYNIVKVNDNSYRMFFIQSTSKARSITFNTSLVGGAKVFDAKGQQVKEIANVDGRIPYLISLK